MVTPKKSKCKKLHYILQSSADKLPAAILLPTPKNRVEYTKLEALEVVAHHYMKESSVIKRILELNYILCRKSTFYCKYKDYKEGKSTIKTDWSAGGRP